ncbi:acyltransferase family protein [Epilithonimonas hungarica]|uniref:Peptidoglycan/LPS O-acetylase OafA/YrhL, contains acyltransferase and SGNH-hydrolase domains n=1 Tax=Epilithonimonas hungarica TaxID=454006 RepID=A0A1G7G2K5_9FLAO|nr:acyltransferase [Epilithonimonas hungarica]SDE82391.1 Peptidoglycan/LPS O-acetylase OafA/YrhL, contains acyltransferase and SGNH-hydrolase domains [Epilithonimonas hungarica]
MLNNLTGLRFYAAFWVFLYHFFPVYTTIPKIVFFEIGYLGVDVFFILSGFILTYVYYDKFFVNKISLRDYYGFIIKRFAKIYPLHFIITLIFIPLLFVGKYIFHQETLNVYPDTLVNNFLLIHAWSTTDHYSWNFPSWSISAEWFAYVFLFVPLALVYRKSRVLFLSISILVILLFLWKWFQIPNFTVDRYTMNGLPRIIPEFFIGIMIGVVRKKITIARLQASVFFGFSLLFLFAVFSFNYYPQQLCVFGFSGVILALSYKTFFDFLFCSKKMIYLGNISYAFYLTQFLSLIIFEQIFRVIFPGDADQLYIDMIKFLLAFCLNLFFASISYRYLEEPLRLKIINKTQKRIK